MELRLFSLGFLPFVFVSTTRFCLTAQCDNPDSIECVGVIPCGRECQKYTFNLFNPVMTVPLVRKGNTLFLVNQQIPDLVSQAQVDRVVVQPEIPL